MYANNNVNNLSFPAIPCPAGMIYQQCGSLCPQTCDNLDQPCDGGCVEGCFCPVGQVVVNGECADDSVCGKFSVTTLQHRIVTVPLKCNVTFAHTRRLQVVK